MKFRNFIIVLLAVLMVFALASCKNEPKVEPKPASNKIYKLTATTGRNTSWNGADKFTLHWDEEVEVGDKLSFKFRSTSEFTQFSVRNDNCAWVYEQGLDKLTSLELGEDGWYTLTYEFSDTFLNGSKAAPTYPTTTKDFRIDLRGNILEDDYLEVKDVTLAGQPLEITQANVYTHSQAYGAVNPTLEVIDDHAWTVPETHVIFFATEAPGDSALPFDYERVAKGAAFQTDLTKAHYTYTLYSDAGFTTAFAADTPITNDMVIYVKYVGDPMAVTFVVPEGASAVEATTVPYGSALEQPADPTLAGKALEGWYKDAEFNTAYEFSSPVEEALTLYAKFTDPVTVSFTGADLDDIVIAKGKTIAKPADPEKAGSIFGGWYADAEFNTAFDFTKAIDADTVIYVKWQDKVWTVTFNMNYEGSTPKTQTIADGEKATKVTQLARAGYFFDGWYTAANGGAEFDFAETAITADTTLYAHWAAPTKSYALTATIEVASIQIPEGSTNNYTNKYWQFRWRDAYIKTIEDGDIFTFMVKFTPAEGSQVPEKIVIMDKNSAEYYNAAFGTSDETKGYTVTSGADGWYTVTFVIAEAKDIGIKLQFKNSDTTTNPIAVGDKLEMKAMALNGVELGMQDDNTRNGIYEGCKPTLVVNNLDAPEPEPEAPASTVYVLTSTSDTGDRFQLAYTAAVKTGDVLTFKWKSEVEFTAFGVRTKAGDKYAYNAAFTAGEKDDDGWYTFSYTIPETAARDEFFFSLNGAAPTGAVLKIKDLSFAGNALEIASGNVYAGCNPTITTE